VAVGVIAVGTVQVAALVEVLAVLLVLVELEVVAHRDKVILAVAQLVEQPLQTKKAEVAVAAQVQ
jgi:hypothetical protein